MSASDAGGFGMAYFAAGVGSAAQLMAMGAGAPGLWTKAGTRQMNSREVLAVLRNWWSSLAGTKRTSPDVMGCSTSVAEGDALAGEDEDFVFVVVLVFGGGAAGGDYEFSHGEGGAAVVGAAEELHLDFFGTLHGDGVGGDCVEGFEDHGSIKAGAGLRDKGFEGWLEKGGGRKTEVACLKRCEIWMLRGGARAAAAAGVDFIDEALGFCSSQRGFKGLVGRVR